MAETILIVDDEDSVRTTFQEWLTDADLGCEVLVAPDAETALTLANERPIDLAILDWNLGAGNNGLQLLEDLYLFNPDVTAILVTGFANQATPLDAMRMGVRDYLDKNEKLDRTTLLDVVRKQLDRLRPVKRQRQFHRSLAEFRDAVAKIIPLVRTTAALNDPVPFTESVRQLFRFLHRTTGAADGVILVRAFQAEGHGAEIQRAYNTVGEPVAVDLLPFNESLAGTAVSLQEACAVPDLRQAEKSLGVRLQPFERGRQCLLAAPMSVAPGVTVVLELFDKRQHGEGPVVPFTEEDRRLASAATEFGADLFRSALADRQTQRVFLSAVEAALEASRSVSDALEAGRAEPRPDAPPAVPVMTQIRQSLGQSSTNVVQPDRALELAELLRGLAVRHGPRAVEYCLEMLRSVDRLLAEATGGDAAEGRS
jgi:ActR/RegA family two-component response regulator